MVNPTSSSTASLAASLQRLTEEDAAKSSKAIFGEHPNDVISPLNKAANALFQLAEIFKTIENEALIERNGRRLKYLAATGAYIANDIGNYIDCVHESMRNHIASIEGGDSRE